jgi:hypothetical protein
MADNEPTKTPHSTSHTPARVAADDHAAHRSADEQAAHNKKTVEEHAANVKKRLGEEREARDKASKDHAKMVADVKPTPTQEENDLAASGVHVDEHEPDGSPPDSNDPTLTPQERAKALEANKPGAYQTRAVQPKNNP